MITHIKIENYALIEHLDLAIGDKLSIITGETGAGKSILLGALSLILGKRADLSSVRDKAKKCIVEVTFDLDRLDLESWFKSNDLDYDKETLLRREITPSGKSRAFINDTPVNLTIIGSLGNQLIDIHSQHQTLLLSDSDFQQQVLDTYVIDQATRAGDSNINAFQEYKNQLHSYHIKNRELKTAISQQAGLLKEKDYNSFLFEELDSASLDTINLIQLEEENKQLANAGQINESLALATQSLSENPDNAIDSLRTIIQSLGEIIDYGDIYKQAQDRLQSAVLELEDLSTDLSNASENVEFNPGRLDEISDTLALVENLKRKHQVTSLLELIEVRDNLSDTLLDSSQIDLKIKSLEKELVTSQLELDILASQISELREQYKPALEKGIATVVKSLGMPDAQLEISLEPAATYLPHSKEHISFLFTANRGSELLSLNKAASGGELSRLMLAVKYMMSQSTQLPTIIFDEIDTGVSGAIAEKMATVMKRMSEQLQVLSITHLPQIAASGQHHYKVAKKNVGDKTQSVITKLNKEERVEEISQMLSGGTVSDAARENARILLQ